MPTERTVLVRLKADVNPFVRGMAEAGTAVGALRGQINTTNDRTAWLTQGILALTPAAVRLGAGAVPAIAGVASQMTVAAAAAGTLALGFNGVGDALKALNDYQIDPTDEHLKKLNQTMDKIGPAGEEFVRFLDTLGPALSSLANVSRAGMFPGIEDGLLSLMTLMPQVRVIVAQLADGIGELAAEGGQNLAGPKFREFFKWLETDARPILLDMGRTVGNVFEGLTNLLMAFSHETRGFSTGLLDMSRSFAEWSRTLDSNQSFQDFLRYVDEAGPQALDFLGQLIQTLAAFAGAAAPVGSIMLPALTDLLEVLARLADTPFGSTLIALGAAMSVYGRAVAIGTNLTNGMNKSFGMVNAQAIRTTFSMKTLTTETGRWARSAGRLGGQVALTGVALSGVADKFGLANTASLAMAGSLIGPWGAAVGAGVGLALDFASSQDNSAAATADFTSTLDQQTGAITDNTRAMAAKALQDDGAFESARALGLSLDTVTAAALGNKEALAEVQGVIEGIFKAPGYTAGGANVISPEQIKAARDLQTEFGVLTPRIKSAQAETRDFSEAMGTNATTADRNVAAHRRLVQAMKAERAAAEETGKKFITLGDDVDNAKVSLNQWIHQLEQQARALTEFGENARKAANRGLRQGLIDALDELGPAGALRMKQLANATESEIARANHAWAKGQQAIQDYKDISVPPKKLTVDISEALARIHLMQQQVDQLHGKTIMIRAQGGHVPAPTDYWTGGYTGAGSKYEPRGVVHAGEVVLDAATVARDWEHIRSRYGYLPGFYDGGYVGAERGQPARTNITVDAGGEMHVTGTLNTPWGPQDIEGVARRVAKSEIEEYRNFDAKQASR